MFIVENWGWPQWVVALYLLTEICLGIALSGEYFGESKTDLSSYIIYTLICVYILDCGGFFNTIRWPQVVWIIAFVIRTLASDHPIKISFASQLIDVSFLFFIFYVSGFFA